MARHICNALLCSKLCCTSRRIIAIACQWLQRISVSSDGLQGLRSCVSTSMDQWWVSPCKLFLYYPESCSESLPICNCVPLQAKILDQVVLLEIFNRMFFWSKNVDTLCGRGFVDLMQSSILALTSVWACFGQTHVTFGIVLIIIFVFVRDVLCVWACCTVCMCVSLSVCVFVFSTGHVFWGPQSDRPQRNVAGPPSLWPPEVWTQHLLHPTSASCP